MVPSPGSTLFIMHRERHYFHPACSMRLRPGTRVTSADWWPPIIDAPKSSQALPHVMQCERHVKLLNTTYKDRFTTNIKLLRSLNLPRILPDAFLRFRKWVSCVGRIVDTYIPQEPSNGNLGRLLTLAAITIRSTELPDRLTFLHLLVLLLLATEEGMFL